MKCHRHYINDSKLIKICPKYLLLAFLTGLNLLLQNSSNEFFLKKKKNRSFG